MRATSPESVVTMPAESDTKAVALIRLNISDFAATPDEQLLTDDQLQTLLDYYEGSINRSSARALRIIAASEVLVGKVIRSQDLSTDGRAVANALRELAVDYDRAAEAEEVDEDGAIQIVDFTGARRRIEAEERRY